MTDQLPFTDPWQLLTPEQQEELRKSLAEMARIRDEAMFSARFVRLS